MIELQAHSTVSDGELDPAGVVAAAAAAGVTLLALTDHDAVDGVPAAASAAREHGLELVPAIEVSAVFAGYEDLHVCGYSIDVERMRSVAARAQEERRRRAEEIVANLQAEGVKVTFEAALAEAGDAASVGRPHIARAAGARDMGAFFERYLVPGARAYVPRRWPTLAEAADLIHESGGTAVLAHPFWDTDDPATVIRLLDDADFDGVECFYPFHDREQTAFLVDVARERGLATTGSSDFHGPTHARFSRFGAYDAFGLGEPELPARRG